MIIGISHLARENQLEAKTDGTFSLLQAKS